MDKDLLKFIFRMKIDRKFKNKFGKYCTDCFWDYISGWTDEFEVDDIYYEGKFKCQRCGKIVEVGWKVVNKPKMSRYN